MKNTSPWYRMETQAEEPAVVDIHIIDFIGDWIDDWFARNWGYEMGVTARAFVEELSKLPSNVKTIKVHLNTPGGDCFAALNIANALRDQQLTKGRAVEVYVDGLAASAGSIIMMAGSKIVMGDNALVMVHNPWVCACGNAAELTKAIGELNKVRDTIVATYKWHSTLDDAAIIALLDAETWMNADEAIANGFATEKVEGLKAAASIDARAMKALKVPDQYKARVDGWRKTEAPAPTPAAAADVMKACREAGIADIAFAESLIAANATIDVVRDRVRDEKAARAAAQSRETQIRALCAAAKQPELADGFVAGGMTVDAVKGQLTIITAKLDKVEIDNHLPSDPAGARKASLSASAIYNERNGLVSSK